MEFARAVRRALATPVAAGAPELALVSRRVAALKRHPLEAPIAASIARFTGALGTLASPRRNPRRSRGSPVLEAVRATSYAAARVAFGFVGSSSLTDAAAEAWSSGEKWPRGSAVEGGPADDEVGVFAVQPRVTAPARLTVAVTQRRAADAVEAASLAGGADGALVARLRGLSVPFRVVEVTGTTRPRGGCVGVILEALHPPPAPGLEEAAAVAATIARQEIKNAAGGDSDEGRSERGLGYEGSKAVRMASDPREAAELAALWSLTLPVSDEHDHATVALSLSTPGVDSRDMNREASEGGPSDALVSQLQASTKRLSSALERLQRAWSAPVLERRDRVERGQGELWLLAASPCGVLAEGETDAGLTALALMTALATRSETRGVALEPWIAPDGVGVMAHGAKLPGESALELTARVAEEAARVLSLFPFAASPFANARAALLGRVSDGIAPDGRAMNALAAALVPGHPSWLAPLGAWEGLAKAGVEGASLRWAALAGGPLRLAVLANEGQDQADGAARVVDRWLVRTSQPRVCGPVEASPTPKSGTVTITIASPPPLAQAFLGVSVPRQGAPDAVWGELTLAGLAGTEGWLAKAVASAALGATAQARIVGGARAAALVVDIRATESSLDAAVAQVRALFERLRQGAMGPTDFNRSSAQRDRWTSGLARSAAASGRSGASASGQDQHSAHARAWRIWAASALRDGSSSSCWQTRH